MEQKRNEDREDRMEIDLLELLLAMKKRWWLILLAALIGGGGTGAFSKFVLTPQYTSTATLYVLSKETTLASLADLQIGSQLTKDYQVIITSRPVLEAVIQRTGLDIDHKKLRKKLEIDNPPDTRIIMISVEDPDPMLAKVIVDQMAAAASDYIGDIMEMVPPKLIEDGEVEELPTRPLNMQNALLGGSVMVLFVCSVITVEVILNDTVREEADVERYLSLTVLASVPGRERDAKVDRRIKAQEVKGMSDGRRDRKKKKHAESAWRGEEKGDG